MPKAPGNRAISTTYKSQTVTWNRGCFLQSRQELKDIAYWWKKLGDTPLHQESVQKTSVWVLLSRAPLLPSSKHCWGIVSQCWAHTGETVYPTDLISWLHACSSQGLEQCLAHRKCSMGFFLLHEGMNIFIFQPLSCLQYLFSFISHARGREFSCQDGTHRVIYPNWYHFQHTFNIYHGHIFKKFLYKWTIIVSIPDKTLTLQFLGKNLLWTLTSLQFIAVIGGISEIMTPSPPLHRWKGCLQGTKWPSKWQGWD